MYQLASPSYPESGIAARLHRIDVGLRAFIKDARAQAEAERKAELYWESFCAEAATIAREQEEQMHRKYAAEISTAREAQAYAEGKVAEYQRIKAQLKRHLKNAGVCKYQDIDPASGNVRSASLAFHRTRIFNENARVD